LWDGAFFYFGEEEFAKQYPGKVPVLECDLENDEDYDPDNDPEK